MNIRFKVQRNKANQIDKLFEKVRKQNTRHHIVNDMVEVKRAKKAAKAEVLRYKTFQSIPRKKSKLARKYQDSTLKKKIDKIKGKIALKYFSFQSRYLYFKYTVLDIGEYIRKKKVAYISITSILVLLLTSSLLYNYLFGYEIIYNGQRLGTVSNLEVMELGVSEVDKNLAKWYEKDSIYYEHSISAKKSLITDRDAILDDKGVEEAIYKCNSQLYYKGGIITVDGVETVRLASIDEAQRAVDIMTGKEEMVSSDNEVIKDSTIEQELLAKEKIIAMGTEKNVHDAVEYMMLLAEDPQKALSQYANEEEGYGLSASTGNNGLFTALNFRKDDFSVGGLDAKPTLTITTVKEVAFEKEIAFKTVYKTDPAEYIGSDVETVKGENGVKEITALITYVNGKETSREIESEVIAKAPVDKVISRGTKPLPFVESSGTFLIPTSGTITTIEGSSSHSGGRAIDIANPTGTPIFASDSGVVVEAGWNGTYGKAVKIDHGGGFVTMYAHCNEINVKIGQAVSQGQVIARMGSTGYSSGPHLHFEIRYHGERQPIRGYFKDISLGSYLHALD